MSILNTSHALDFGPDFDTDGHFIGNTKEPPTTSPLNERERSVAEKPTLSLLEVNDVGDFPSDFDAGETILARHLRLGGNRIYSVNEPRVLKYAAHFFAGIPSLIRYQIEKAIQQARLARRNIPADVVEATSLLRDRTLRVLLNSAPRNQRVSEGKNGCDFHLGVTNDGVEIYACPKHSLQYIRSQLAALFRIPSEGHPLTEDGEQFRSSLYAGTAHQAPEHLELLWRRGDHTLADLNPLLPEVRNDEVAFKDVPFKNRRVHAPHIGRTWEQIEKKGSRADGTVAIRIGSTLIRAHIAKSLAGIPEGQWGAYWNPADTNQSADGGGFYELNRRFDVGKEWFDEGQNPDEYLNPRDAKLGVPVVVESTK